MQSLVRTALYMRGTSVDHGSRYQGAFLTGIIVPREGGLTIALTEKLEDMVSIIFLPLVILFILDTPFYDLSLRDSTVFHPVRTLYRSRAAQQWFV
jgi:hypothetical protein